jgi:hypothetical protein
LPSPIRWINVALKSGALPRAGIPRKLSWTQLFVARTTTLPGALAWSVAFARRFGARCCAGRAVARVRVARRRGAAPRVASIGGGADDLVALHARSGVEVRHPRVERAGVPTSSARNPTLSVCRRSNASERSGMRGWQRPLHASASESCVTDRRRGREDGCAECSAEAAAADRPPQVVRGKRLRPQADASVRRPWLRSRTRTSPGERGRSPLVAR